MKLYSMVKLIAGAIVLTALLCTPVIASTWYVDNGMPASGNGLSWATAFKTIQEAIDAAFRPYSPCYGITENIWVKEGTYYLDSQIEVYRPVKIYGGFQGTETTTAQRNISLNPTIIDGDDLVRCFYVTAPCTINGFTIRNGYTTGSGGGIYIDGAISHCSAYNLYNSPDIRSCTFTSNTAGSGGAVYVFESDAAFTYCTFRYNTAQTGGAVYHQKSSPQFQRCTFAGNSSTAPSSLGGGALAGFSRNFETGVLVAITNCLFYDNVSNSWGGAISYNQVYPTITHCTVTRNDAAYAGGAFHGAMNSEAPKIRNSIFWGDAPDELDITTASTYLDVRYSTIEGGWSGSEPGNIDADPAFVSGTNFRLTSGSPCVDATISQYGVGIDIAGGTRPVDGDGDDTALNDMGAYEYNPTPRPYYPYPTSPFVVGTTFKP